jgi:hypothetical protein
MIAQRKNRKKENVCVGGDKEMLINSLCYGCNSAKEINRRSLTTQGTLIRPLCSKARSGKWPAAGVYGDCW